MKSKLIKSFAAIACVITMSGCSTVTKSALQPVAVSSKSMSGEPVTGAQCVMKSDKGTGKLTTPTVVKLKRSNEDLLVHCVKPGHPDGNLRVVSRASASLYGNIILGGAIGAGIDHASGKAYDYPSKLEVVMGESTIADRRSSK